MKTITKCIVFTIVLSAISCATGRDYNKVMATWNGRSINEYVAQNGTPAKVMDLPGDEKVYEYQFGRAPSSSTSYNSFTRTLETDSYDNRCYTTLITDKAGVIKRWQWKGRCG